MKIGIIGGTGLYDLNFMKDSRKIGLATPYGAPSDLITAGSYQGKEVYILPRHGEKHTINPSNVNYRANIHALKELGVTHILAPSAVGSLKENYKPGDLVFTDQFIDRTTQRRSTFYDNTQVCHISIADPLCKNLHSLLVQEARKLELPFHEHGTLVVIEGPRFSTKAESEVYRSWNADIIGMTLVPECILAREAQLCYASIATVTDYDVWKDHPVTADEVIKTMKENDFKVKRLLEELIPKIPKERTCSCKDALKGALL